MCRSWLVQPTWISPRTFGSEALLPQNLSVTFNTNIWSCSGDSQEVLCISSREMLIAISSRSKHASEWRRMDFPTRNLLSRLAPNVCHSHKDAVDQVVVVLYFRSRTHTDKKDEVCWGQENVEARRSGKRPILRLETGCSMNNSFGIKSGAGRRRAETTFPRKR
jgi:hypothetical protein